MEFISKIVLLIEHVNASNTFYNCPKSVYKFPEQNTLQFFEIGESSSESPSEIKEYDEFKYFYTYFGWKVIELFGRNFLTPEVKS